MKTKYKIWIAAVLLAVTATLAATGIGIFFVIQAIAGPAEPRENLNVRLDSSGPYLMLATERAEDSFATAIEKARELHPMATLATFDPQHPENALDIMREQSPRYVMVFIEPDELDVNFAWQWLRLTTQLDDDPLVDVRTGFITGATPEAAAGFVERIAKAARGEIALPGKLIDNLGPNMQAGKQAFYQTRGCFMIPVFGQRVAMGTISHGTEAFTDQRLETMADAGLVHFGGHGYPDRVVDGLSGSQAGRLKLSPCVVFNGACYTGVTHTWYEQFNSQGTVRERTTEPNECFCLSQLGNTAVAYLAALHPDHGIPVYQEMEYLAYSGSSLGDVMKYTHDGVILASGGQCPDLPPLVAGAPSPQWTPSDVMLNGTAARVLFGDPALIVCEAFTPPPFDITVEDQSDGALLVTAVLANEPLKSTYTDTYHADLSANKQLFNDRALIVVDLPADWDGVGGVTVSEVTAGGAPLPHRLVGYAVERDGDSRRLHVQVDLPTTGYMQSRFRQQGSKVVLHVRES